MSDNIRDPFYISRVYPGELNALVKHMMQQMGTNDPNEAVKGINSGAYAVTKALPYSKADGVLAIELRSDGTTGPEWIRKWRMRGYKVPDRIQERLLSPSFEPTNGVTYRVVIVSESAILINLGTWNSTSSEIGFSEILEEAGRRNLSMIENEEIPFLLMERFTKGQYEKMGFKDIVVPTLIPGPIPTINDQEAQSYATYLETFYYFGRFSRIEALESAIFQRNSARGYALIERSES
ncbi:MAG TPA: hypothetical protein VN420_01875 [Candidatus Fimivivens sp.]|nr:hypothetical protein [Candidatus Fimivivens sp.]